MSYQQYPKPTPQADCLEAVQVATEKCVIAPVRMSEIRRVITSSLTAEGVALSGPSGDVSILASWTGVISNSDANKARELDGSGELPDAGEAVVIVNGRSRMVPKKRTFGFDIASPGDLTTELLRKWQHGYTGKIWPLTKDGRILGGQIGITADLTKCEPEYLKGDSSVVTWKLIFEWYELISPPDAKSPFTPFN